MPSESAKVAWLIAHCFTSANTGHCQSVIQSCLPSVELSWLGSAQSKCCSVSVVAAQCRPCSAVQMLTGANAKHGGGILADQQGSDGQSLIPV